MLLFCVKTIVKDPYEEEREKKKKKKKNLLAVWQPSGSVLLQCFFVPLGILFIMKTLKDVTIFEILRDFFCIITYRLSPLSLHVESTNSMIIVVHAYLMLVYLSTCSHGNILEVLLYLANYGCNSRGFQAQVH